MSAHKKRHKKRDAYIPMMHTDLLEEEDPIDDDFNIPIATIPDKDLSIRPGVLYAITINPNQQPTKHTSLESQVSYMRKYIDPFLNILGIKMELYMELSDSFIKNYTGYTETMIGRYHFHGTIQLLNWAVVHKLLTGKLFPPLKQLHLCIKPIDDIKKWKDYCTKQHIFDEINPVLPLDID